MFFLENYSIYFTNFTKSKLLHKTKAKESAMKKSQSFPSNIPCTSILLNAANSTYIISKKYYIL